MPATLKIYCECVLHTYTMLTFSCLSPSCSRAIDSSRVFNFFPVLCEDD